MGKPANTKLKKIFIGAAAGLVADAAFTASSISLLVSADNDPNAVTSTSGSGVDISIAQYERSTQSELQAISDRPVSPSVYSDAIASGGEFEWKLEGINGMKDTLLGGGAVDRFVFVKNTGSVSAYVRIWLAFEQGSVSDDDFETIVGIHKNDDNQETVVWSEPIHNVTIEGNTYTVISATYTQPIGKDKFTEPSLLQVYMKKDAGNADFSALDGDGDGKYKIRVHAQAAGVDAGSSAVEALNTAHGNTIPTNWGKSISDNTEN